MADNPDLNTEFPTPEYVVSPTPPMDPEEPDDNIPGVSNPDPVLEIPGPAGWPRTPPNSESMISPPFQYAGMGHRGFPSFLTRSGGVDGNGNPVNIEIPYWVRPDTYTERYQDVGGATVQVNLIVDSKDAPGFIKYGLGYSIRVEVGLLVKLRRWNPMQLPYDGNLYLSDLTLINRGESRPGLVENWPEWNWLEYRATFTDPPYTVADDLTQTNELYRYIERTYKPSARERIIPGYSAGYIKDGKFNTLQQPGFTIDQVIDHVFVWHRVPCSAIPKKAISELIGKCNDSEFDSDDPDLGIKVAAETLLFRGFAKDFNPYRGRDGGFYVDIAYLFQERKIGWTNYPDQDGVGRPFRYGKGDVATDICPVKTGDFWRLFEPE